MQAKKSLGQNFLRDPKILKKIADFAQIEKEDFVLEIGPGEGGLTAQLLEQAKKVIAIEKDERMVAFLKEKFANEIEDGKLEVIEGDVLELEVDSNSKLPTLSYKLIGNIPYYITGALFKKFLETEKQPKSITFVVQKEVAERILARDGKESILSISIKAYGTPEYGGVIKAGSFYPKPKVDSAIISIRDINKDGFSSLSTDISLLGNSSARLVSLRKARSENPSLGSQLLGEENPSLENQSINQLEQKFFEVLKAGFAHKRKLLIKNLESVTEKEKLIETFKKCDLSIKIRAEDLKVEDWISLLKELEKGFPL